MKKKWPECWKNHDRTTETESSLARSKPARPGRTRNKAILEKYHFYPYYVLIPRREHRNSIPRSLCARLYEVQVRLLLGVDKYVNGFFDSANRLDIVAAVAEDVANPESPEWEWRNLWGRCQGGLESRKEK